MSDSAAYDSWIVRSDADKEMSHERQEQAI